MSAVHQCDVCGKTSESSIAFASLEIETWRNEEFKLLMKEDFNAEACSVACMLKLLRKVTVMLGGSVTDVPDDAPKEPEPESKELDPLSRKPGFFEKLFGL